MKKQLPIEQYLKHALEAYIRENGDINITNLAKDSNLAYSTVYQAIKGSRQINASSWLKIMESLGAVKRRGSKIVIETAS